MSPRNRIVCVGVGVYSHDRPTLRIDSDRKSVKNMEDPKAPPGANSDTVELDKSKVDFTLGGVDKFKFYPDNPENHRHKYRFAMKEPSKYYDPCEETRQASINCMIRNPEDKKTVCQDFFDAYKECKRDFFNKKRQDKREGKKGWGAW